jgi:GNAT superfamily N-acetyltransferase
MSGLDGVVLHIHGPSTAVDQLEVVKELYADAFFPPPHNQGPVQLKRMAESWPSRLTAPGFRLVVAEHEDKPIGCIYGHQLAATTKWWQGAIDPIPEGVTREFAGRTLGVIDMMVRSKWRRHGVAQALHSHFLVDRTEERATLLVDPINTPARAAYAKWGYDVVGRIQPFPDMPKFEAMVKQLRK